MFFITPGGPKLVDPLTLPSTSNKSSLQHKRKHDEVFNTTNGVSGYYPKRNQRACDRCRLRKAKCTGGDFCEKCKRDGVICTTTRNPKSYQKPPSAAYVQMVESQRDFLIRALEGLSKSRELSKSDIEKIIHELHIPAAAHCDNRQPGHSERPDVSNEFTQESGLTGTRNTDPESDSKHLPQELHELSSETSEMDNWLTSMDDPWGSFINTFDTLPSLPLEQPIDIMSYP